MDSRTDSKSPPRNETELLEFFVSAGFVHHGDNVLQVPDINDLARWLKKNPDPWPSIAESPWKWLAKCVESGCLVGSSPETIH